MEFLILSFYFRGNILLQSSFLYNFKNKKECFFRWTDVLKVLTLFTLTQYFLDFDKTMNLSNTSSTRLVILLVNYQNILLKNCSKTIFFVIFRSLIGSNFGVVLYIIHFSNARGLKCEFFVMSFSMKNLWFSYTDLRKDRLENFLLFKLIEDLIQRYFKWREI